MVSRTQIRDTHIEVQIAFAELANRKDFMTDDDIRNNFSTNKHIMDYLLAHMPNTGSGRDYSTLPKDRRSFGNFIGDQCFFCSPRIAWTTDETLISILYTLPCNH
jgi:hypothetical protein